jgi:hypothetical protein
MWTYSSKLKTLLLLLLLSCLFPPHTFTFTRDSSFTVVQLSMARSRRIIAVAQRKLNTHDDLKSNAHKVCPPFPAARSPPTAQHRKDVIYSYPCPNMTQTTMWTYSSKLKTTAARSSCLSACLTLSPTHITHKSQSLLSTRRFPFM